ncbi:Arc family DNA-binding protein [Pseudomonas syringae group genomosp. 7]|uniref:Arc family DNA-binding protein n=1 Tax=Pseudomonas syringae group genomosp. 7 TaxID=251699 RepID=UPI000EFB38AA|nr:Arc family DNA-binding protein [Pseudomonas syringae group genomosp. 7]
MNTVNQQGQQAPFSSSTSPMGMRGNSREADKFVVRMPDGMRSGVDAAAAQLYTSMNTFVVQAVAEKLDRQQRQDLLLDALADTTWRIGQAPDAYAFTSVSDQLDLAQRQNTLLFDMLFAVAETEGDEWNTGRPTQDGAYWVRGNGFEGDILVEVTAGARDDLHVVSHLFPAGARTAVPLSQFSEGYEWLGPLRTPLSAQVKSEFQELVDAEPAGKRAN